MNVRAQIYFAMLAAAVPLAWSGSAFAYDKEAATAPGWRYEIQPYGFIPIVVSGNATVVDRQVPIDVTAGDLLSKLELAAELRFEAWNGPFGVMLNGVFTKLGNTKSLAGVPFNLTSRTYVGDAWFAYRFGPWPSPAGGWSGAVDIFAGFQIARLSETLDIEARSRSADATFGKGIVGARGILRLSPSWALVARALVGAPDVIVSVGGAVELDLSRYALRLGYLYDQIEHSSTLAKLDVSMHGPYLGFGIRFGSGPIF